MKKILIIGSGPIIISQACEFDYSGTQACKALKEEGFEVILINSNPATIMTDPETADRIYIEPVTPETVIKVIEKERPDALLPTLGGQTALNTAIEVARTGILKKYKVEMIGASEEAIKKAEDRELFRDAMNRIGLRIPKSGFATNLQEVEAVSKRIGFPIIVRPAFTLGGTGGGVAYNMEELNRISKAGIDASLIHQVMLEESVIGWKEYELEVMRAQAFLRGEESDHEFLVGREPLAQRLIDVFLRCLAVLADARRLVLEQLPVAPEQLAQQPVVDPVMDGAVLHVPAGIQHLGGVAGNLLPVNDHVIAVLQLAPDAQLLQCHQDAVADGAVGRGDAVVEHPDGNDDGVGEVRRAVVDGPPAGHPPHQRNRMAGARLDVDVRERLVRPERDGGAFPLVEAHRGRGVAQGCLLRDGLVDGHVHGREFPAIRARHRRYPRE